MQTGLRVPHPGFPDCGVDSASGGIAVQAFVRQVFKLTGRDGGQVEQGFATHRLCASRLARRIEYLYEGPMKADAPRPARGLR